MKVVKRTINILILLSVALVVSIIWTGGFEIQPFGASISCYGLTNPIGVLTVLLLLRLFLSIGGRNSLTLIFSLLFAMILAEGGLWLLNPPLALPSLKDITQPSNVLGYQLVPNLKDNRIQTNSHGLRDREREWQKPNGVMRLLGLGDSFTFGYQVDLKDCYLKQLEKRLNVGKDHWDVINAGVVGYNMSQYLAYFENYGYRYEPDLVTIGLFFDDFFGNTSTGKEEPAPERYRTMSYLRVVNFIRNGLELMQARYRYLSNAGWLKSIEERREVILKGKSYPLLSGKANPEVYNLFESRLGKLAQKAKEKGARVLAVLIPDVVQLNHPELQGINHILRDICKRRDVEYLDITPVFEKAENLQNLYLLPVDAHTSPEGHRIIAEAMKKKIKTI